MRPRSSNGICSYLHHGLQIVRDVDAALVLRDGRITIDWILRRVGQILDLVVALGQHRGDNGSLASVLDDDYVAYFHTAKRTTLDARRQPSNSCAASRHQSGDEDHHNRAQYGD